MNNLKPLSLAITVATASLTLSGCKNWFNDNNHVDTPRETVLTASVNITPDSLCTNGGTAYSAGVDSNRDGTLDTEEVTANVKVCDGVIVEDNAGELITTASIGYGDARCATGGVLLSLQSDESINEAICNDAQSTDDSIDLISSFSANPANPEVNSQVTLTVATARQPADGESFTYHWKNTTTDEAIVNNSPAYTFTAPSEVGAVGYQITVKSSLGQEEQAQVTLSIRSQVQPAAVDSVTTTTKQVFIPTDFEQPESQPQGDFDGALLYAGETTATAAQEARAAALSVRKVAAFIAERPVLSSGNDATAVLNNLSNTINLDESYSVQNVGSSLLSSGFTALGSFDLSLSPEKSPTEVANELVQLLAVNRIGGTITNLPAALESESTSSNYRLELAVTYLDMLTTEDASDDRVLIMATVVEQSDTDTYKAITSGLTDGTNIADPNATTETNSQAFIGSQSLSKADFLFVIDNSGSMRDEQQAVADAADTFINRINSSGLDYQIGTINTGSSVYLADTNEDGGFTSDLTEFKSDVINQGTSGSHIETGIYNAELSLLSTSLGNSSDGAVTTAGYPRADASLSVVILSDEASQYSRRAGTTFDVSNNLFLDRNYRVFSIVTPDPYNNSQYDELALATGGRVADISGISGFESIMDDIAVKAGAAASQFQLPNTPISGTITVSVNGTEVPKNNSNGWAYFSQSNSIVFYGSAVPSEGDSIEVVYEYITTSEQ